MSQFQFYWTLFIKDLLTLIACLIAIVWLLGVGMNRIDWLSRKLSNWIVNKLTRNRKPEDEEPQ